MTGDPSQSSARDARREPPTMSAVAVPGLPEVTAGTDLAAEIARCCRTAGMDLRDDDVVVVASKVVAKAEGRSVPGDDRSSAIDEQTVRVVAERALGDGRVTRVVQSRTGPVLAAAGVDSSDVAHGTVLLLPVDPDASARRLRTRLRELTGAAPAVLVSDSAGRPWRQGVADFALGAAGLVTLDDARGRVDRFGRPLEVTVRAVGDEVASLADLVKGKVVGLPVAVVRGLGAYVTSQDGDGARGCVRTGPSDWFAFGAVEAVRAALGVGSGDVVPPPIDPSSEDDSARVARAVAVARGGSAPAGVDVAVGRGLRGAEVRVRGEQLACGVMAERLRCALWSEGLTGELVRDGDDALVVVVGGAEDGERANSGPAG
ncbi:MAG: coenzyme F420-0:L-glutamate ligase [Actinomycetes bacterium]